MSASSGPLDELVNRAVVRASQGPPEGLTARQRACWQELANRVCLFGARSPDDPYGLKQIPGIPARPERITREMLEDIARWKAQQLQETATAALGVIQAADFNPSLHPRGPDGKFISRPWDVPGGGDLFEEPGISETSTHKLVEFMGDVSGEPDVDAILSDDGIRIDGIPDDIDSLDELKDRMSDPQRLGDVPSNPVDPETLEEGDIINIPGRGPREVIRRGSGGILEVKDNEESREAWDPSTMDRSTVPKLESADLNELPPSGTGGQDDTLTLDDVTVDELTPENPDFVEDKNGAMEGDFVRIDPKGLADRDDPFVAEVTERRFKGAEYTVETKDGEELEVGAGTPRRVEGFIQADTGGDDGGLPDPDDPSGGEWVSRDTGGVLSPEEGDIVKFDSPRFDGVEVGRVVIPGGMGPAIVETEDGEEFKVGVADASPDNDVQLFEGLFQPAEGTPNPEDFVIADDFEPETVDIMEAGDTAAERREAVDTATVLSDEPITADMVESESVPVGAIISERPNDPSNPRPAKVLGYEDDDTLGKQIVYRNQAGLKRTRTAEEFERSGFHPIEPRPDPDVTIPEDDWGDESTPMAERKDAVRSVLDETVAKDQDYHDGNGQPIDDATFDKAKDQIAGHLAHANDKEFAETVIGRLSFLRDEISRANASIDQTRYSTTRANFGVSQDEREGTIIHELGHAVGDAFGFKGGSNDLDGETDPMPSFKFQADDVFQKYSINTPQWSEDYDEKSGFRSQEPYMIDDWTDDVEDEIGTGLDGRNFSPAGSAADVADGMEEGSMIRFADGPGWDEPRNWKVVEVEEDTEGLALREVVVEDRSGRQERGELAQKFGGPHISWNSDSQFSTFTEIDGTRSESPDDWREDTADADEWLGSMDADSPEETARQLGDKVNKAWYRQMVATRELGERDAEKFSIRDGYSAKQAHETMSRIHQMMRTDEIGPDRQAKAARTLVKYHPDLLEAYRNAYRIPGSMAETLDAVLEEEGHDFRFSDGTPWEEAPNVQAVRTLYETAEEGATA